MTTCQTPGRACPNLASPVRIVGVGTRSLCPEDVATFRGMGFDIREERRAVTITETRWEGIRRRGRDKMRAYRNAVIRRQLGEFRMTW
jgi:ribosome-interacting GTPase 1